MKRRLTSVQVILGRFVEYLDLGLMFGDYEADEVTSAVVDFSEYKSQGKTPMYFDRALGRLLDTVYFTQSHHSRFLQVADLLIYMADRHENQNSVPGRCMNRLQKRLGRR